jgi:hypothetical protein
MKNFGLFTILLIVLTSSPAVSVVGRTVETDRFTPPQACFADPDAARLPGFGDERTVDSRHFDVTASSSPVEDGGDSEPVEDGGDSEPVNDGGDSSPVEDGANSSPVEEGGNSEPVND